MIRAEGFAPRRFAHGFVDCEQKAAQAARFFVFYLCASDALKGHFEIAISFAAF